MKTNQKLLRDSAMTVKTDVRAGVKANQKW